jgi:DNA-binding CsgD family transcriptional regulator/tetratricopeptide (TPR) repeat protein
MGPVGRPPQWVGRVPELATLSTAVGALRRGSGSVVWVEGEPGIGKSSVVAEAVAEADPGWNIGWGTADKLTERLPLRVMLDCLQVRPNSPDKRRAHAADLLRSRQQGLFGGGDASVAGIEMLLSLVDELCVAAPTILIIDDLQWVDDASLIVWHQLAASIDQLRLLLVATCWPSPRRPEVQQVRVSAVRRGGQLITLGPLPETEVAALVTAIVGSPPGEALRQLTAQVAGNPLYLRELVDALVRERALEVGPAVAEVAAAQGQLPASLTAVLIARLSSVSAETADMLRTAALLRGNIAVTDLALLMRKPVSELAAGIQEAAAAGILVGSGSELAFRHQLIRQALYESMPMALRTALHAEAARDLAAADADAVSVAQQLSVAGRPGGGWARAWLIQAVPALAMRAPQLAAELLRRELNRGPGGDEAPDGLMVSLAWVLLSVGSYQEAAREAGRALTTVKDPVRRAELFWVLARAHNTARSIDQATATLHQALESPDLPHAWRARMLAWLAVIERDSTGDLDAVDVMAHHALAVAREADDAFATVVALTDLWLSHSLRRDHASALETIDQALHVLDDDPGLVELRSNTLNVRIFTLQNLDRWSEAELTLRQAREIAQRSGIPDQTTGVSAAVLRYWLGQWDDALAELGPDDTDYAHAYLRERWPALLAHGVAALIAGRRDERTAAAEQLRQGLALPSQILTDRENLDFLVTAHAVALEQSGETRQAMLRLAGILPRRDGEMTLTHQWLPHLVRLAIAGGDAQLAQAATRACEVEAAAETRPARAAAASLRCRGLLGSDPVPLSEAVAHYRAIGPAAELPAALEDLAAVLAGRGRDDEARTALNEAVTWYEGLGARWDIRRADGRLRRYGIRRGVRGPRQPRATSGWAALTPTEIKIAALVAGGESTSQIASGLFLSRRTVQKHISSILAKLGANGRVEIVREVLRQGIIA